MLVALLIPLGVLAVLAALAPVLFVMIRDECERRAARAPAASPATVLVIDEATEEAAA